MIRSPSAGLSSISPGWIIRFALRLKMLGACNVSPSAWITFPIISGYLVPSKRTMSRNVVSSSRSNVISFAPAASLESPRNSTWIRTFTNPQALSFSLPLRRTGFRQMRSLPGVQEWPALAGKDAKKQGTACSPYVVVVGCCGANRSRSERLSLLGGGDYSTTYILINHLAKKTCAAVWINARSGPGNVPATSTPATVIPSASASVGEVVSRSSARAGARYTARMIFQ
jgi:hypothetical protein